MSVGVDGRASVIGVPGDDLGIVWMDVARAGWRKFNNEVWGVHAFCDVERRRGMQVR